MASPGARSRDESMQKEEERTDWQAGSHVFVLSNAGKPIFSTAGGEADLSSLTAVMQAIVSFVRGPNGADELQCVEGGGRRLVFLVREPLYLVAATDTREPTARAARTLHFVHLAILFILTASIEKVFTRDAAYDLRSLLGGTDRALRGMVECARTRPDVLLDAVACAPLPVSTRGEFGRLLQLVDAGILFALLTAKGKVVSLVSPRRRPLCASDVILLHNMLRTSPSLRAACDESWVPLCLPGFEARALLHAHISFLDARSELCLVLLTHRAEDFERLAAARQQVTQRLSSSTLGVLRQAMGCGAGSTGAEGSAGEGRTSSSRDGSGWHGGGPCFCAGEVVAASLGIPHLRHFLYLDKAAGAYVCARFPTDDDEEEEQPAGAARASEDVPGAAGAVPAPGAEQGVHPAAGAAEAIGAAGGTSASESELLLDGYARLHAALHAPCPPLSLLFASDGRRALLGHCCGEYELYSAHSPLCSKAEAGAAAGALLRWLQKERAVLLLERQLCWPA